MKLAVPAVVTIGAASLVSQSAPTPHMFFEQSRYVNPHAVTQRTSANGSYVSSWAQMVRSISKAGEVARGDGNPLSPVALQLAYSFAARMDVPGAPVPAISDNEAGGIVFYWVAGVREIQVEIDGDTSYFVRVRDEHGAVRFIDEGVGEPPYDEVRSALEGWRAALSRGPVQTLQRA